MNKTDNKEINKRVRELREMKKLTQKEFGENINVTREAISSIENGSNNLTERNLKSICDFYNVNEEWLRHGEGAVFKKKIDYKAKAKQMELKQEMIKMILELEEGDIEEAYKALILLWDKDYTRLTTEEEKELEESIKEIKNGEYYTHEEMLKELKINEQWLKK